MPRIHLSFTERRRRRLALKVDRLDRLEKRSTVTPFSAFSLAAGAFQGLAQIGLMQGGGNAQGGPVLPGAEARRAGTQPQASGPQARGHSSDLLPIRVVPASNRGGGGAKAAPETAAPPRVKVAANDKLTAALAPSSDSSSSNGIDETAAWKPASRTGGGGAMAPRGGSGNGALSSTVAAVQGRSPRTQALKAPAPPPNIPGMYIPPAPQPGPSAGAAGPITRRNAAAQHLQAGTGLSVMPDASGSPTGPTITENPSSLPYASHQRGRKFTARLFPILPSVHARLHPG